MYLRFTFPNLANLTFFVTNKANILQVMFEALHVVDKLVVGLGSNYY